MGKEDLEKRVKELELIVARLQAQVKELLADGIDGESDDDEELEDDDIDEEDE